MVKHLNELSPFAGQCFVTLESLPKGCNESDFASGMVILIFLLIRFLLLRCFKVNEFRWLVGGSGGLDDYPTHLVSTCVIHV